MLATLKRILIWAHGHGWVDRVVGDAIRAVRPDAAVELARKGKKRRQLRTAVPLDVCVEAAQHLVFIDAVAMWVQRLLGTRLHETFGPVVGDLLDLGDYGILTLEAQGADCSGSGTTTAESSSLTASSSSRPATPCACSSSRAS